MRRRRPIVRAGPRTRGILGRRWAARLGDDEGAVAAVCTLGIVAGGGRPRQCRAPAHGRVPRRADGVFRETNGSLVARSNIVMTTGPIVGLGEVLWDLLPTGKSFG